MCPFFFFYCGGFRRSWHPKKKNADCVMWWQPLTYTDTQTQQQQHTHTEDPVILIN